MSSTAVGQQPHVDSAGDADVEWSLALAPVVSGYRGANWRERVGAGDQPAVVQRTGAPGCD
jgi:hypothetical protein